MPDTHIPPRPVSDNEYHAFVSYAKDCEQWAQLFIENLEELGLAIYHRGACGRAETLGQAHEGPETLTKEAMARSRVCLLIVSPASPCCIQMQRELKHSRRYHIHTTIPIFISEYDCPDPSIANRKGIHLAQYDVTTGEGYANKVTEIVRMLGVDAGPSKIAKLACPAPWVPSVKSEYWNKALDIMGFVYTLAEVWDKYLQGNDKDLQYHRLEAQTYLYNRNAHKSLRDLCRELSDFHAHLTSTQKLVRKVRPAATQWYDDAYRDIQEAEATETREQADEAHRAAEGPEHAE